MSALKFDPSGDFPPYTRLYYVDPDEAVRYFRVDIEGYVEAVTYDGSQGHVWSDHDLFHKGVAKGTLIVVDP